MTIARATLRRWLRRVTIAVACVAALPLAGELSFRMAVSMGEFPAEDLERRPPGSWRLHDAQGRLLREAVSETGTRSIWVPIDELPPVLIDAIVAVEDARFFEHDGVDRVGLARAAWQNLRAGRIVSGASTITMQVARLVHPHPRTLLGKIGEMIEAARIERTIDKRRILEQYLNRAPFGSGTIGVEAASRRVFGKPASHLSLAESALLAGLLAAPTRLDPHENPLGAMARQRFVLERMREVGSIDDAELARAMEAELALADAAPPPRAMHFTEWVLAASPAAGEVTTTLDGDLQEEIERLTAEHARSLAAAGVTNAAVVVLDNRRCEVIAMVGSADYWAPPDGAVNGATARRQPGSTLKPFTYAMAFDRGATPAQVVPDVETTWGEPGTSWFSPRNYSNTYSGPVMLGDALARSLNVPAVHVAEEVGVDALLAKLREIGFVSLDAPASRYGLGLTLGNGEVTLVELAQGYAMLARGGSACRASGLPVHDEVGAGGPDPAPPGGGAARARSRPSIALSREAAWLVTDILSDEARRMDAFGPANALLLGFPVAVKTGTSSNWRDSWAVGYTDRFTVAVWTGDFAGRPLRQLAGANGAGPLFHRVMRLVVDRAGPSARPRVGDPPPGIVEVSVCPLSGLKAGPACPHRRAVRVPHDHAPDGTCGWHREIAIDRRNGLLASDACDASVIDRRGFTVLPPIYAAWAESSGWQAPPTKGSPFCPPRGTDGGAVAVSFPLAGDVFVIEPGYDRRTQTLPLAASIDPPEDEVTWIVDGSPVAKVAWPYRADWPLAPGRHEVAVAAGGVRSAPVTFEVR
jgi:penicillin-binding protein 1C